MQLAYQVSINGQIFCSSTDTTPAETRGTLQYAETQWIAAPGVTVAVCEERHAALPVTRCWLEVRNSGESPVRLGECCVGLATSALTGTLHYYSASWGKEFTPQTIPIPEKLTFGARSGRSSETYAPWLGLETETGHCCLALAWSGNWHCEVANRTDAFTAVMGLQGDGFATDVAAGECFAGPMLYMARSDAGAEEASLRMRRFFLEHGCALRPDAMETLPVTYNTWWCYEDRYINETVCGENAALAAQAGMTHFVLDAGWFGDPHAKVNWFGKRGDWDVENRVDFPAGLAKLGEAVNAEGIAFGIWCEIESIGAIAQLNQTHPQWVARREGQSLGYLCMANPETRAWAMRVIDRLVTQYGSRWIKLDFNVSPGLGCDEPGHTHGSQDGLYRHVTGYYALLDAVRAQYPGVVLENCASGGMRTDLGILSHAHFAYMSDHDYVDNHFQCFWGATSYLPAGLCYQFTQSECISDHNRLFNPITEELPLSTLNFFLRASLLSTCGFSYRLADWKPEWRRMLADTVALFREISRKYIWLGDLYRLTGQALRDGGGDRWQAYQYMAQDDTGYAFVFRLQGSQASRTLHLQGLKPDALYDVMFADCPYRLTRTGQRLMEEGIAFAQLPEWGSEILTIAPGR